MLFWQALSCLFLGVSLTAAQNICLDDRLTLFDFTGNKTTVTCTDDVAGDTKCEGKSPGYLCTPGTSGSSICCGLRVDCNADFVAKYDRSIGDFVMCQTEAGCAALGASYQCQNGMCCAPVQRPAANCNLTVEIEVAGKCIPKAVIGAACADSMQCPAGSGALCVGSPKTCQCPAASPINVNNVCMPQVALGAGSCSNTLQCQGGSTCNPATQKCECPVNSINKGGICTAIPPVAVGNTCLDDRFTFIDPATKTSVPCTYDAAGDAKCEGKSPGYVCTPGTSGPSICCGLSVDCNAGFVAKYDRSIGDFVSCQTETSCAALGASYQCQNGMCCAPVQPFM